MTLFLFLLLTAFGLCSLSLLRSSAQPSISYTSAPSASSISAAKRWAEQTEHAERMRALRERCVVECVRYAQWRVSTDRPLTRTEFYAYPSHVRSELLRLGLYFPDVEPTTEILGCSAFLPSFEDRATLPLDRI